MPETIPSLFFRQAESLSGKPLFFAKEGEVYKSITWKQAAESVLAFSVFLLSQKVNPGDRIVLLSENRPEWGIADLAIQSVGAWTVPIYPTLTAQDLLAICRDCEPVLALASSASQVAKLLEVGRAWPSLRAIVALESGETHPALVLKWSEALLRGREMTSPLGDLLGYRRSRLNPEDTATLIYTSGTTGEPKGVMLSHRNFLSNVASSLQVIPVGRSDLHLSFLPLSHVFERMAGWYLMLAAGASVAYAQNMDTIPQNMLEVRPTIMLGVPRFFEKLAARIQENIRQAPPLKRRLAEWAFQVGRTATAQLATDGKLAPVQSLQWLLAERLILRKIQSRLGGRLRFFVSGSAPLSREIAEFFYGLKIVILEGYGLTETSPVIAVNRPPQPRFGSVGRPIPGVEVRIAEDGEILTKGAHVMQGYYKKPDATAETLRGGWLHTGDIGHLDGEGYLFVTDRKRDLIKTAGGKFVAPQKLENLFMSDSYISQAFVYGDKKPFCVALIVPNAASLSRYAHEQGLSGRTIEELVRHPQIREFYWQRVQDQQKNLASFEQIKKIELLGQEFSQDAGELTPTLKAKRSVIARHYEQLLQGLYQSSGP